ncbi:TPA: hypothetical protein HA251_03540 [Candidatus Woesearchaeota archaeon]|nr:hypothetical protein [Candidatus Woesearchaeota archaeon]
MHRDVGKNVFKRRIGQHLDRAILATMAAAGITYAVNNSITNSARQDLSHDTLQLEAITEMLSERGVDSADLTAARETIRVANNKPLTAHTPFWVPMRLISRVARDTTPLRKRLDEQGLRRLRIGIATDYDPTTMITAVQRASRSLRPYGIELQVAEIQLVRLPPPTRMEDITLCVKDAFDNPHDYIIAHTIPDKGTGAYPTTRCLRSRISVIQMHLPENKLAQSIRHEVLKYLAESTATPERKATRELSPNETIDLKPWLERYHERDQYRTLIASSRMTRRTLSANIILDKGVDKAYAAKIVQKASDFYERELGISIQPVAYARNAKTVPHDINEQARLFRASTSTPSDIYIFLTRKTWVDDKGKHDHLMALGQADVDSGYIASSVATGNVRECARTIAHEIAHLFKAKHNYREDSLLHPITNAGMHLTFQDRTEILEHKFRTWK